MVKIKTKIDKFGRIVIPKNIRNELGLRINSEVYLESVENGLMLHPEDSFPFVTDKEGVIVVCSEPTSDFTGFLKKEREDRIKTIVRDIDL